MSENFVAAINLSIYQFDRKLFFEPPYCCVVKSVKIFDKMVKKKDFLKWLNTPNKISWYIMWIFLLHIQITTRLLSYHGSDFYFLIINQNQFQKWGKNISLLKGIQDKNSSLLQCCIFLIITFAPDFQANLTDISCKN